MFDFGGKKKMRIKELETLLESTKREAEAVQLKYGGISDIESSVRRLVDLCKVKEAKLEEVNGEIDQALEILSPVSARAFAVAELGIGLEIALGESEKALIRAQKNVKGLTGVTAHRIVSAMNLDGSASDGKRAQKSMGRLMKIALDGQYALCKEKLSIRNFEAQEAKLEKIYDQANSTGAYLNVELTDTYLAFVLCKLREQHALLVRNSQRKELEKQQREIMREEARREREQKKLEKDLENAAKEEARMTEFLEQARKDAIDATGHKLEDLQSQIFAMDEALKKQQELVQKARSMSQLTKSGHVYVISNQGSFGENCYKIGATRALDPNDRVKDLGDASVPFVFDTHAMIYSEDAFALESELHRIFDDRRKNLVNSRKEFFEVSINEIEQELLANDVDCRLIKTAIADEYRQTLALKKLRSERSVKAA